MTIYNRLIFYFTFWILFGHSVNLIAQEQAYPFARPDRYELISKLQTLNAGNRHPRLYANSADFSALRQRIRTDEKLEEWYKSILKLAEKSVSGLDSIPFAYDPNPHTRMPVTRFVPGRIYALSMAYQISGKQKYADRAYKEMEAIASWPQWGTIRNFLKIADVMQGFSVGYDWCYSGMTPAQRTLIKNAIIHKGLDSLITVYNRNPTYKYVSSMGNVFGNNNWNPWCNGAGFACALVIGDEEPLIAGEVMERALRVVENFAPTFGPDGASVEGLSYGNGSMNDYIKWIAAMETSLGTSYNYFEVPGIAEYAYFPIYLNGPVASLNFHDSGGDQKKYLGVNFYLANKLKQPLLGAIRERAITDEEANAEIFDILWYKPPYKVLPADTLPLDKYFKGNVQTGSFRSSFTDPDAIFLGFHAGENEVTHTHLDIGHFNIDAMGFNWALDLGTEDLTYQGSKRHTYTSRYDLYRLNPGGHNTLLIGPSHFPGQSLPAFNPVIKFVSEPSLGFAIVDMTAAYRTQVNKALRGFALTNNRTTIVIQDELDLKQNTDIWWFMHTKSNIKIGADAKLAILYQHGKEMKVRLLSPHNGHFEALQAEPLPGTKQNAFQTVNMGIHKLAVKVPQVKNAIITVEFTLACDDNEIKSQPSTVVRLDKWNEQIQSGKKNK